MLKAFRFILYVSVILLIIFIAISISAINDERDDSSLLIVFALPMLFPSLIITPIFYLIILFKIKRPNATPYTLGNSSILDEVGDSSFGPTISTEHGLSFFEHITAAIFIILLLLLLVTSSDFF